MPVVSVHRGRRELPIREGPPATPADRANDSMARAPAALSPPILSNARSLAGSRPTSRAKASDRPPSATVAEDRAGRIKNMIVGHDMARPIVKDEARPRRARGCLVAAPRPGVRRNTVCSGDRHHRLPRPLGKGWMVETVLSVRTRGGGVSSASGLSDRLARRPPLARSADPPPKRPAAGCRTVRSWTRPVLHRAC